MRTYYDGPFQLLTVVIMLIVSIYLIGTGLSDNEYIPIVLGVLMLVGEVNFHMSLARTDKLFLHTRKHYVDKDSVLPVFKAIDKKIGDINHEISRLQQERTAHTTDS